MTSQEKEYFFENIKDVIATLRLGRQRPDNRRILKNLDQNYTDQILQEMLRSNLIYNRPAESGPSYYVTYKNGYSNVDANNTDNPE